MLGYVIERKYKLQDDFWKVGGTRLKCPHGEVDVSLCPWTEPPTSRLKLISNSQNKPSLEVLLFQPLVLQTTNRPHLDRLSKTYSKAYMYTDFKYLNSLPHTSTKQPTQLNAKPTLFPQNFEMLPK